MRYPIINEQLDTTNDILRGIMGDLDIIAARDRSETLTDYESIGHIIGNGGAASLFNYGDQLKTKWKDNGASGSPEYDNPLDICNIGNGVLKNGEVIPIVTIAQHYATTHDIPFDPRNAAFVLLDGSDSLSFYFKVVDQPWFANDKGKYFTFTLPSTDVDGNMTMGVLPGTQFVFTNSYNATLDGSRIEAYSSGRSTKAFKTAIISEGRDGVFLGELTNSGRDEASGINSIQCALLGYNRWSTSVYRQYLNAKGNDWYKPATIFSRPPSESVLALPGYMDGYSDEFLSIVNPTRVRTALNHVTDAAIGEYEDTYDFFFLPSLSEIYTQPQVSNVDEGEPFEYYKRALGLSTPSAHYPATYDAYKIGSLSNHIVPVYCRLRSAYVTNESIMWYVNTSGYVNTNYASNSDRSTPACRISSKWV